MIFRKKAEQWGWVDDEPDTVRPYLPLFESSGLRIEIIDAQHFEPTQASHLEGLLLDLDNGQFRRDGIEMARTSAFHSPGRPIAFVSRFLNLERFRSPQKRISPLVPTAVISKSTLARASRPAHNGDYEYERRTARAELERAIHDMQQERRPDDPSDHPVPYAEASNAIDFDVFKRMSRDDRAALILGARSHFATYLDSIFRRSPVHVEWVVMGLHSGEILEWGTEGETPPRTEQALRRLAMQALQECMPVVFHRPRFKDF